MGTATPVQLLHTLPAGSSAGQSRSAAWSRPAEPFIRGLISPLQSRRLPSPCCLSSPLALSPPGGQSGHRACTAMPCEVTMGLDCWRLQRGAKWGAGPRSHPRHLGAPLWTHTLTRSGHVGISRVLFQVSEEQQKHLGETYRPGRGAFRAGFLPSIGPQLLRPNKAQHAWGQTEEEEEACAQFLPSFLFLEDSIGPPLGGRSSPAHRTIQRTHPAWISTCRGLPAIWGG